MYVIFYFQANSLIPPPYSSAPGSVEQINAQTAPNHEVKHKR